MMTPVKMPRRSSPRTSPSTVPRAIRGSRRDTTSPPTLPVLVTVTRPVIATTSPPHAPEITASPCTTTTPRVHPPADLQVAVAHDHEVGDRAADEHGAVDGRDRTGDDLTATDLDVTADADAAIARCDATAACERGRGCESRPTRMRARTRGPHGSGACARALWHARTASATNPRPGRGQEGVLDPSSMVAVWL